MNKYIDVNQNIMLLKGIFAVSCVALVICFTMPFVTIKAGKDSDIKESVLDDFRTKTTVIDYIHMTTYNSEKELESLDERIKKAQSSSGYSESLAKLEEQRADYRLRYASGLACVAMIMIFVFMIALSSYQLGVVERLKEWDTSFVAMRNVSFVPLLILVVFFVMSDTLLGNEDDAKVITVFNYIPLGVVSLALPIAALNISYSDRRV